MNIHMLFIMMSLIFSPSLLFADAIVLPNPNTGEIGFWMPRADMEEAAFALAQVPLLKQEVTDMQDLRKKDLKSFDDLNASYNWQGSQLALYKRGFWFVLAIAAIGTVGGFILGVAVR